MGRLTVEAYLQVDPSIKDDGYDDELADLDARVGGGSVLVAVLSTGTIVGAVTYVPSADAHTYEFTDPQGASLRHLAVSPVAQGQGIGRALVAHCVDLARKAGRDRVLLHTLASMDRALTIYLDIGFVRDPDLDEWWGDVKGLAYRLELS
ncbi:MAG: GNAT family N-acetyltransferase [Acidimicrobiales bacterium]